MQKRLMETNPNSFRKLVASFLEVRPTVEQTLPLLLSACCFPPLPDGLCKLTAPGSMQ